MDYAELLVEVAYRVDDETFAMWADRLLERAEQDLSQIFGPHEYRPLLPIKTSTTNWLFQDHSDIYIAAMLKQYYLFKLDTEKAQAAQVYLDSLVSDKKIADRVSRYAGEQPAIKGPTP